MIECSNLRYTIEQECLLNDFSWAFPEQKISAIIGPNGAGKSTLLKLILGILTPSQGRVSIKNRQLESWPLNTLAHIRAYMAQKSIVQLRIPVYEYLALARIQRAESVRQCEFWVNHTIHTLDLGSLAQKTLDCLSGGEFQRVELARAWCQLISKNQLKDTILLLDEPSSALDIHQTDKLYKNLQTFVSFGGSVIIVEHDINLAARYSDQILMLKAGECIAAGNTTDVFTQPNINQCFDVHGHLINDQQASTLTFSL